MSDRTPPQSPTAVVDVLRARRLEIVDDDGRIRIVGSANAGGSADISVYSPQVAGVMADPVAFIGLQAGMDTEMNGVGRANINIHDGTDILEIDTIEVTTVWAQLDVLQRRCEQLEMLIGSAGATLKMIDRHGPPVAEVSCPICEGIFTTDDIRGHMNGEECSRQAADNMAIAAAEHTKEATP